MSLAAYVFFWSAAAAAFLIGLFYVESRRGKRIFESVRRLLDRGVDWLTVRWHTLMLYIGSGAVRVGMHYLLHRFLRFCAALLQVLYQQVEYWRRRNRRIARTVQAARTESHLTAIAEHKQTTALTEEEKVTLKEKTLSG